MSDYEARKAALKRIKDRLDDVPVQKIIDPSIKQTSLGKAALIALAIAAGALTAVEYLI